MPQTEVRQELDRKIADQRFHRRTLIMGAAIVAGLSYVVVYVDLVVKQLQLGVLQFSSGAVGAFFLVYAAIKLLRRLSIFKWVSPADLLVLYIMIFMGVFVCSRGLLDKLLPAMAYVNGYADSTNHYRTLFFPHLNPALVVGNPHEEPAQPVSFGYFNGSERGIVPWEAWAIPCLSWFVLFALIIFTFLCLSTVLRKQWADDEKLSFPQTILPLQIFDDHSASALFGSKLMWIGFFIPFTIYGINGLHECFPTVPRIPLEFDNINLLLTSPPWDQLQSTAIFLSFAAIGFAYLIPTELLFSLWFFFLLTRIGDVIARGLNIDIPGMPMYPTREYIGYQSAGAYIALTVSFFYGGRKIIGERMKRALRFEACAGDEFEMLPQRTALWGIIISFVGIVAWCVWAGINAWFAAAIFAIYLFVTCVVLSRGVSEAGLLITETSFRPGDVVGLVVPESSWSHGSIVGLSMLNAVFFRDTRGLFMGLFLDAQRMAEGVRLRRSALISPIIVGIVVAFIVGTASHLQLAYTHGAATLYGYGPANAGWADTEAGSLLTRDYNSFPSAPFWFAIGIAITAALIRLRSMFVGFPLSPIAYALCPTWGMYVLWFPIFVTFCIKSLILRYGSTKLYREALPLFLGLIIGEVSSAGFWAMLAAVFKISAPSLPLP